MRTLLSLTFVLSLLTAGVTLFDHLTPPVDLSVEKCELLESVNADRETNGLPRASGKKWFKCVDIDGNVAYRPAIQR